MTERMRLWKDNVSAGSRRKRENDVRWTTKGTARRTASALANMMLGKGVELGQKRDSVEKREKDEDGHSNGCERVYIYL